MTPKAAILIPLLALLPTAPILRAQEDDSRSADAYGKAPWQWTMEERINERLNPQRQEERRQRALARGAEVPEGTWVIQGATEPEVFFPQELFNLFVKEVLADDPRMRQSWRTSISDAYSGDLPDDFWVLFEEVGRELKGVLDQIRDVGQQAAALEGADRDRALVVLDDLKAERCTVFKRTLRQSRDLLPAGEFEKLLYEGVTPGLVIGGDTSSAELLRRVERGC